MTRPDGRNRRKSQHSAGKSSRVSVSKPSPLRKAYWVKNGGPVRRKKWSSLEFASASDIEFFHRWGMDVVQEFRGDTKNARPTARKL